MKLQNLRALRALMRTGSVTKAAGAIGLTQPAVSRLISTLEEEVGFSLFAREQGRLLPTRQAELFYRRVERVLDGVDDLSRVAREIASHREGSLVLLCTPQAGYTVFPEAIAAFTRQYPNIRISLEIVERRDVARSAQSLHYDMGFTAVPFDAPGPSVRQLFTLPARLLLPPAHRLARRRKVEIRDLQGENIIMLTKENSIRPKMELELAKAGISYRSGLETSSPFVASRFVALGLGIAVADPFSPLMIGPKQLANRPMSGDITLTYGFFFPESRPVPQLCEEFVTTLGHVVSRHRLGPVAPR
ncbi:LysR family transcriptional regulator [Plastoroseomonas hellenica]|uniref:LysR family transcriptional regulator n=1 Tax=Plastoroseomonas hellenica TaxID=2687306 RepID=UPI001BAB2E02|nr:LysR family transcriptional regulator [Plastoroseomonas hellenica]MBR0646350.1 LysR family transcriptional regulator [Plastoroseomonas hellenica]